MKKIAFGILVLVVAIVIYITIIGRQNIETSTYNIITPQFVKTIYYKGIIDHSNEIVLNLYKTLTIDVNHPDAWEQMDYFISASAEHSKEVIEIYKQIDSMVDPSGPERVMFNTILSAKNDFEVRLSELVNLIHKHNITQATLVIRTTFKDKHEAYIGAINDAINIIIGSVDKNPEDIAKQLTMYQNIIICAMVIVLLVAGFKTIMWA